jgi:F-type H+-transporting ATPase subunit delta
MTRRTSAARRYAEAVHEIARRDGTLDAWLDDLRLAAVAVTEPEVARVVDNPAVPAAARREVLETLLGPRISRLACNLVLLLAARSRLALVPPIAAEYKRLLDLERGVVTALVTSPMPLGPADLAAVTSRLGSLTGRRVEVQTRLDPALVGGLTIRVGDQLIDASVRGRLERLRDRLVVGAR